MQLTFFIALLISLPLWAQLRRGNVSTIFGMATLTYTCIAIILYSQTNHMFGLIDSTDISDYKATIISLKRRIALESAVLLLFFAGLVKLQEYFGSMTFPKTTKILFWIIHFTFLTLYWFPTLTVLNFLSPPLDLGTPLDYMVVSFMIDDLLRVISNIMLGALLLLIAVSAIIKWSRRHR